MSLLYQHIEQMSREKGVDAGVIVAAVEDAILTAAKKYYATEEPYQARFNKETWAFRRVIRDRRCGAHQ